MSNTKTEEKPLNGEDVLKLRQKLGLTQLQLGERLSTNDVRVCNWEKNKATPNKVFVTLMRKLEEEFDLANPVVKAE